MDPVWAAVAVGVSGFALWLVTQLQILRAVRLIQADIDAKRATTEAFVHEEIGRLESLTGGMEARLTAQIPPHPEGELNELRERLDGFHQEFVDFGAQIGGDMKSLPARLHAQFAGQASTEQRAFQSALAEAGKGVEDAMSVQEAMAMQDPEALKLAMMKKISDVKVTDKFVKEHPYLAILLEPLKVRAMEVVGSLMPLGRPGVHRVLTGGFQER